MLLRSRLLLIVISIYVTTLLTSCVPPPSLLVVGVGEDVTWQQGQKYLNSSVDGVEVSIAYISKSSSVLIFDVSVINNNGSKVLVDPVSFTLQSRGDSTAHPIKINAMNPEAQIEKIDKRQADENSRHSKSENIDGCLLCLDFVGDVTRKEPLTKEEQERERQEDIQRRLDQIEEEQRHENSQKRLKEERRKAETTLLRKTTLFNGETIGGKVNFKLGSYTNNKKYLADGDRITITILINKIEHSFEFSTRWKENY